MSEQERIERPPMTLGDRASELFREATKPLTLGYGKLFLDTVVPSQYSKRRAQFETDITDAINRLIEQGRLQREKLDHHEQFISNYAQAVMAAVQTHEAEKLKALRNAVLNTALDNEPDDTRQRIFMRWIEELTPLHLKVLDYCREPREWPVSAADAVEAHFPESKTLHISAVIVDDLIARKLITPDPAPGTVYYVQREPKTTPLGSAFLSFIRDPLMDGTDDGQVTG